MTLFSIHIPLPLLLLGSGLLALCLLVCVFFLGLCRGAQQGDAQLAALVAWHKAHGRAPFGGEDE